MELTDRDAQIFYQLFIRYNPISPNIGIIGNSKKFEQYIKKVLAEFKNTGARIIVSENKKVYRILINDIEYTYIHITDTTDLRGRTFKKFI